MNITLKVALCILPTLEKYIFKEKKNEGCSLPQSESYYQGEANLKKNKDF